MLAATAVLLLLAVAVVARQYKRVPPDALMVVYGRPRNGVGYVIIPPGGGKFVHPVVEASKFASLKPRRVRAVLNDVPPREGPNLTLAVDADVRLDIELAPRAEVAGRFMLRSQDDWDAYAIEALAKAARARLAEISSDRLFGDPDAFCRALVDATREELGSYAMVLEQVHIHEARYAHPQPGVAMPRIVPPVQI